MSKEKKEFYSNCIFEAIKAKLKNKNIKIHIMFPFENRNILPHACWEYGNKLYGFEHVGKYPKFQIWFKGKIATRDDVKVVYMHKEEKKVRKQIKIAKKQYRKNLKRMIKNGMDKR